MDLSLTAATRTSAWVSTWQGKKYSPLLFLLSMADIYRISLPKSVCFSLMNRVHQTAFILTGSMTKILKCAANDDCITIRAEDTPELVSFIFESPSASP
jgi:hypothetical protein